MFCSCLRNTNLFENKYIHRSHCEKHPTSTETLLQMRYLSIFWRILWVCRCSCLTRNWRWSITTINRRARRNCIFRIPLQISNHCSTPRCTHLWLQLRLDLGFPLASRATMITPTIITTSSSGSIHVDSKILDFLNFDITY